MALDTYSGLLSGLATLSVRSDLTATWPTYVELAHAQINRALAEKPIRPMIARADATIDEEFESAPADMIRPLSFVLNSADPIVKLEHVQPENLARMKAGRVNDADRLCVVGGSSTTPRWYAHVGTELQFYPAPADGESYTGELTYVQRVPALSEEAATNWLLTSHPDVYLFGALMQFAMSTQDERLGPWSQAYQAALAEVLRAYPAETNKARLRTDTPLSRCY